MHKSDDVSDVRESPTRLARRVWERLTLYARGRSFILTFTLINTMVCLLLLLLFKNAQLTEKNTQLAADKHSLEATATRAAAQSEATATEAVAQIEAIEATATQAAAQSEATATEAATLIETFSAPTPTPTDAPHPGPTHILVPTSTRPALPPPPTRPTGNGDAD